MKSSMRLVSGALGLALAAGFAFSANAADFYKGKRLTILINYSAGGPTDIEARLFARHIGDHIAGHPQVISKNMAGAGGIVATNYLGQKARPNGETIGYFTATGSAEAFKPLKDKGLRIDPRKFGLVATQAGTSFTYVRKDTPPGINKPEDIMKAGGLTIAGLRALSSLDLRQRLAMDMLGIKHKYITGYRGSSKARVAVMQGEANLHSESQPSFRAKVLPTMIKTGMAIALYYYPYDDGDVVRAWPAVTKGLDILPFNEFYEKVKGKKPSGMLWKAFREVNRAGAMVQRGVFLPPNSPKAALEALRAAVRKLNKDPAFAKDAMKTVNFVPEYDVGAAAEKLMRASTKLSPDVVKFLKEYVAKVTKTKS
jgi:tripartite-type tricarboxylate transporter receptor subunit TctC